MARLTALLLGVLLLAAVTDASAVSRVTVSGTIDTLEGDPPEGIAVGDPYVVVFEYIPASANHTGISGPVSIYDFPEMAMQAQFTIGAYTFFSPGTVQSRVNQYFDRYQVWADALAILSRGGGGQELYGVYYTWLEFELELAAWVDQGSVYGPGFDPATALVQQPGQLNIPGILTGMFRFRGFKYDFPGDWTAFDNDLSAATATITFEGSVQAIPNEPTSFGAIKSLYLPE